MTSKQTFRSLGFGLLWTLVLMGCATPKPGTPERRSGDEIVVAGQLFHTGTRVVLWMDPGGYDAYRVERRFSPFENSSWEESQAAEKNLNTPNRYGLRRAGLSEEEVERLQGGGWDLPSLQRVVDQFVMHYDGTGTSRQCFKVLHDLRGLSVHFLLDLDGTIYQTLDLKERAWHATSSNTRSIGIEIANIGAYSPDNTNALREWYHHGEDGVTRITIPARYGDGGIRTKEFVGRPLRAEPVSGLIQGKTLIQYDYTPEQYRAVIRLTAALTTIFPKLKCEYPRGEKGSLCRGKLPETELNHYSGILGHYHVQLDKIDPGPAFQWDRVVDGTQRLRRGGLSRRADQVSEGHMRVKGR